MLLSIPEFIGHLHPVLVHLPIGILLLACLFLWQSRKDKSEHLQSIISVILFWGMISAILSCVTGYVLSTTGDYDERAVSLHQWMGISVAIVSILTYYLNKKNYLYRWQGLFSVVLLLMLIITGHLGGSLTHGSDYLTQPLRDIYGDSEVVVKRKPIPNVQEAAVYTDILEPVFKSKCYGCHGPTKQKGKLRLDQPALIMKGGKDGVVIKPGNASSSELIKRILLPREDEHHMAPKEKPQLSVDEKSLIGWWVDNGADFIKKVKDLPQPPKIKIQLIALQKEDDKPKSIPGIPETPVEKANEKAINTVKESGAVILPVSQNSNYLEINFLNSSIGGDSLVPLLIPFRKQLVSLKLSGRHIPDTALAAIGQCRNISILELDHTDITDKGVGHLKSLDQLQSINLVGTNVTANGVMQLKGLKKLRSIYLYQAHVDKKDWPQLSKNFRGVLLDSGGYTVPLLETDTMIVKPPPVKK